MTSIQRVGIIANREIPHMTPTVRKAIATIEEAGREVMLATEMATWLGYDSDAGKLPEFASKCQLFLVFGGDGTFLRAARVLENEQVPLLGINMGGLGFLTVLRRSDFESTLHEILDGHYRIEKRMRLHASLMRKGVLQGEYLALNDAVMHMSHGSRLVEFGISVGAQYLGGYRADGLIVATPTGSTAYSMSAGGPIVHPTMNALVATPICPHALSIRPLLVAGEEEFTVRIGERSGEAILTLDGMVNVWLQHDDEIKIVQAKSPLTVILPENLSYYALVREKLGWGGGGQGQGN